MSTNEKPVSPLMCNLGGTREAYLKSDLLARAYVLIAERPNPRWVSMWAQGIKFIRMPEDLTYLIQYHGVLVGCYTLEQLRYEGFKR